MSKPNHVPRDAGVKDPLPEETNPFGQDALNMSEPSEDLSLVEVSRRVQDLERYVSTESTGTMLSIVCLSLVTVTCVAVCQSLRKLNLSARSGTSSEVRDGWTSYV